MFVHSLNLEKFPSQLFSQLSFQMGFLLLSHACWPTEVCECVCQLLISVQVFVTPWTVAHQAPLSIESSRQEQWSGLPFPSPGHLPNPGIEPGSPALQTDSLPSELPGKPKTEVQFLWFFFIILCQFQVYNIVSLYFYGLYTSFKLITKQWVYFPVLGNISLLPIYFIHTCLRLLILYPCLAAPPFFSPLVATSLFSISVNLFLFCYLHVCFISQGPHVSNTLQHLSVFV